MNSWYELSQRPTAWWPLEILRLPSSLIKAAVLVLYGAPSRHSEILLCPSNDFRNRHPCLGLDQLRQFVHALFSSTCFIAFREAATGNSELVPTSVGGFIAKRIHSSGAPTALNLKTAKALLVGAIGPGHDVRSWHFDCL